jgi:hypothetical protein
MLDLVIVLGGAALQILLAAIALYLALRLPAPLAAKPWIAGIALCSLAGLAMTGVAMLQSERRQAELRSENATLHSQLAQAQESSTVAAKIDQLNQQIGELKSQLGRGAAAPRSVTEEQQKVLPTLLREAGGVCELGIRHAQGSPESEQFAAALAGLMQQAGWKLRWPQLLVQDKEAPGVWVMVHREADAPQCAKVLLASLNAVGIEARGVEVTALAAGTFDLLVGMP